MYYDICNELQWNVSDKSGVLILRAKPWPLGLSLRVRKNVGKMTAPSALFCYLDGYPILAGCISVLFGWSRVNTHIIVDLAAGNAKIYPGELCNW